MTTRNVSFVLMAIILITTNCLFGQNRRNIRSIFIHTEYQLLNYNFLNVGLGYQPRKNMVYFARSNPKFSFIGWTVNYTKKLENKDWGASIQAISYSGSHDGPFGLGIEVNYKSVNNKDHFCFKPLIGLSFPVFSIMYAYNIDFYDVKSERINQHELILGLRLAFVKMRK